MDVVKRIREYVSREEFRRGLLDRLVEICAVDTTPRADLALLRANEERVFAVIAGQLQELGALRGRLVKSPIPADIQSRREYSRTFYASPGPGQKDRGVEEVYAGRYNLLYLIDGEQNRGGRNVALNAHIDVVPPFHPPRREGEFLYGRGTADDKGNAAAIIGALAVLDALAKNDGLRLRNKITAMFVIDEEIGGNGSLALAVDAPLMERCDTMLVLECTNSRIHPANRGAVHLSCRVGLKTPGGEASNGRLSTVESMVYAILELEREGDTIKKESRHPLFPHRPVQTCTGMIGEYGVHPSTLCGEMSFRLTARGGVSSGGPGGALDRKAVIASLRRGLAAYIARHGDKTRSRDATTGERKVHHHLTLGGDERELTVTVHGAAGHMGSLLINDSAITKWAYMARELIEAKRQGRLDFDMHVGRVKPSDPLLFEGGQGFLPTHGIEEIMQRVTAALSRGVKRYLELQGAAEDSLSCEVKFEKLHNDAFASRVEPRTMRHMKRAALQAGLMARGERLVGWDVSCDARLFAKGVPRLSVITCGAGKLEFAHSEQERVPITELFRVVEFLAQVLIAETGSRVR